MAQKSQEQYKQVDKFIVTSHLLGKGSFGSVFRGFFKDDHSKIVAVKVIPIERISNDQKFLELLKREIDIMQKIEHKNIVRMYGASRTSRNLYMFIEYCNDGDLKMLLKKNQGVLSESVAKQYLKQIVDGFKILYNNNIIHRDIKPANILLHEGVCKIADFGFARVIDSGMEDIHGYSKLGTPLYMSPQILNDQKFSSKADIWSLGMMFYEMLYGRTPWTANSPIQLYNNIKQKPLVFDDKPVRSQEVKKLLTKMLVIEDQDRIGWQQMFEHELLVSDNSKVKALIDKLEEDEDDLLRSVAKNNLYVEKNKIMGFDKNLQNQTQFIKNQNNMKDIQRNEEKKMEQQDNDFDLVLKRQDQQQKEREVIMMIDSYFSFERNIAIFINYASTLFFNFYNKNKNNTQLNITQHQFYQVFFLFQKYQIIIFTKILTVMDGAKIQAFDTSEWQIYQKSHEYVLTQQAIKNDKDFMLPYFREVLKSIKDLIHKTKDNSVKSKFKELETVIDQEFDESNQFKKIYENTLIEFLNQMKSCFKNQANTQDKDFLLVIRFTLICIDPYKEFKWNKIPEKTIDFHKFYEYYETIEDQVLKQEVQKLIK